MYVGQWVTLSDFHSASPSLVLDGNYAMLYVTYFLAALVALYQPLVSHCSEWLPFQNFDTKSDFCDKETKRQRDKETKRQKYKKTRRQRDKEINGHKSKTTKRWKDKKAKKEAKRQCLNSMLKSWYKFDIGRFAINVRWIFIELISDCETLSSNWKFHPSLWRPELQPHIALRLWRSVLSRGLSVHNYLLV